MISRLILPCVIFFMQIVNASANQSVEAVSALAPLVDSAETADGEIAVESAAEQSVTASQESLLVPINDEQEHEDDNPNSRLPTIGFVPEDKRRDGGFNLVAERKSEAQALLEKSVEAENKKLFESALKLVQKTLMIEPDSPRALLAQGRLLVKTQQFAAAKSALSALITERSDDWRPWFWLGTANLMMNDLAAAEIALEEALAKDADVVETWLHRALVEQQRGNWQVAIQLLSIANEVSPDHPLVMLNAAMCREALGYRNEAADAYRKFLTQSHRSDVSKLLRFEVLNHLSNTSLADVDASLSNELESSRTPELAENEDIVAGGVEAPAPFESR